MNLKGKSFLKLLDFTPEEITGLLDLAAELKDKKKKGIPHKLCEGKNIALVFEKSSTRTRCAFEVAGADLGMHPVYLDPSGSQMGKKESIADTARVLGRMFDGIEYRGFGQEIVEELAFHAKVPVWNGLTNEFHPTQILADFLTIREYFGDLKGIKLVYMGDARYNMGNSLMIGCAKMGMHFVGLGPKHLAEELDKNILQEVQKVAQETGATIEITDDRSCLKGADVIYGDIWASMGEEDLIPEREKLLSPYRVTMDMLKETGNPDVIYLHCLPSFHDMHTKLAAEWKEKGIDICEVTDEVFRSKHSVVFDEAENRMHAQKAVLYYYLKD